MNTKWLQQETGLFRPLWFLCALIMGRNFVVCRAMEGFCVERVFRQEEIVTRVMRSGLLVVNVSLVVFETRPGRSTPNARPKATRPLVSRDCSPLHSSVGPIIQFDNLKDSASKLYIAASGRKVAHKCASQVVFLKESSGSRSVGHVCCMLKPSNTADSCGNDLSLS